MTGPDLTLLVPCYEEGARIDLLLDAVAAWSRAHAEIVLEVLVVDDGSTDDTAARADARIGSVPGLRVLALAGNRGKGAALKAGVAEARGASVLFLDADLAVDAGHVAPALSLLREGADVVIGCRNVPGAAVVRPQRALRRWLGRSYRALAVWWLGLDVSDVTCGFKAFRAEVAKDLFARSQATRWGFDAEILYLARRRGCDIRELPVRWSDGEASAVRLRRDLWGALRELAGTRRRHKGAPAPKPAVPEPAARRVAAGSVRET